MSEPVYDRRQIERLLPYLWNDSHAYRATDPYAPDPDMPRGQANPARSCNLWAEVADVRRAWKSAGLTLLERRAIVCEYGIAWSQKLAAKRLGLVPSMLGAAVYEGVGKMLGYLEGEPSELSG